MDLLRWIVGAAAAVVVIAVAFGLVSGRLNPRVEGCCPSDPARDRRMRVDKGA